MQKYATYLKKDWVIILLLGLATIPAFSSLEFKGYFPHHDDLQVMRIFEMEKCFADWQIPCRWIPDMGYGYGYPLFNFYPPLPSYLGALIRAITHIQLIDTVKVSFGLQMLVSTILMYLFAKQWWGRVGGVLSALFYLYAPYHALDLYVRGALNESWAMAFAPGIGWALTRLKNRIGFNNIVLLGLMTAGMLLSHNPMTMIFAPLLAVFGLILVVQQRSWKLLAAFVSGGAIGIGLAAFFTLPVLFEQKYVHIDTLYGGYFNYTQHFVSLNQLFLSRYWGFGGSVYGLEDHMAFPIGYLQWIGVLIAMALTVWLGFKRRYKLAILLTLFIGYFWLTAFLMHERSSVLIWSRLPILATLQFPWRFLSTTTFTSCFVVGAVALLPVKPIIKYSFISGLIIAVFALNIPYFAVEKRLAITDSDKLQGQLWELQRTASIFDYLPIYAVAPPGREAPGLYQILAGAPQITAARQGSASTSLVLKSESPTLLRFNILDFPNWQVFVDGQVIAHNHDNYLGLITAQIPAGEHLVVARLTNTPIRTISNIISLVTMGGLLGWYSVSLFRLVQRRRKQK